MKQDVFNFKFKNKKDFYVTSKNSLAFDLIQKWPNWNNQFFFYMDLPNVVKLQCARFGKKNLKLYFLIGKILNNFLAVHMKKT